MTPGKFNILITTEQIQNRVKELAAQISNDYDGKFPILVSILKGAVVFLTDLMRALTIPHEIDFMSVSSYGSSTKSSGVVRILQDLSTNINNCDVIIVEDIIDTGLTLNYICENLKTRHPNSLKICTLLYKKITRSIEISADYVGFYIPNQFVIGYGLDYAEKYRHLPFIATLENEISLHQIQDSKQRILQIKKNEK